MKRGKGTVHRATALASPVRYYRGMKRPDKIADLEQKLAELRESNRRAEAQLRARRQRLENAEHAKKRKLETRRKILRGDVLRKDAEADAAEAKRQLQRLDARLTRDRDRALFGLPPLGARPLPGWHPYSLTDGSWGAEFTGDTSGLPAELVGLHIIVTPQTEGSKPWTATVTEVVKRTPRYVRVRREDRP